MSNKEVLLTLDDDGTDSPHNMNYSSDTGHLMVCWLDYVSIYYMGPVDIDTDTCVTVSLSIHYHNLASSSAGVE